MNPKDLNVKVVTLKDLWDLFLRHFVIIFLAGIIGVAFPYISAKMAFIPQYASTATLYLTRQSSDEITTNEAYNDFSLALRVVKDCDHLLKSHSVLDTVRENLDLEEDYKKLYKMVSTENPENTRILEVTVKARSPQLAKEIVDEICTIGTEKIEEAMGFKQVNFYEYGTFEEKPCNSISVIVYIITGILGAAGTYAFFLILYLLDDTLQEEEDIERYLGIAVIGNIPNSEDRSRIGYGYYAGYKKGNPYK